MTEYFRVRNFEKYQHYKDRNPPWIKLYRELFHNPDFDSLSILDRYCLIGIMSLASQHENKLPVNQKWLMRELDVTKPIALNNMVATGWIEVLAQDASNMLADSKMLAECLQDASPRALAERRDREETEKRREEETPSYSVDFQAFWEAYPNKTGKGDAFTSWKKNGHPPVTRLIEVLMLAKQSRKWKEGIIPNPATWLNQKRWDDDYGPPVSAERKVVY